MKYILLTTLCHTPVIYMYTCYNICTCDLKSGQERIILTKNKLNKQNLIYVRAYITYRPLTLYSSVVLQKVSCYCRKKESTLSYSNFEILNIRFSQNLISPVKEPINLNFLVEQGGCHQ